MTELCGKKDGGLSCVREKGHQGLHEYVYSNGDVFVWGVLEKA